MNKIAVIDLDSVAFAIGNGVKLVDEKGEPIREEGKRFVYRDKTEAELMEAADQYMNGILANGQFTHYIGYIKGLYTTKDRLAVNKGYKAHRPQVPPKWWCFVKDDLIKRWGAIEANYHEVDDYVNVTRLLIPYSYIVSIDGDLLSLEGTHFHWGKNEWITKTKNQEQYKFWYDMICGQTVDNIKGLPGKGPKYATNLLSQSTPTPKEGFRYLVLEAYTSLLGEYQGIKEFYKNYISLKILESIPQLVDLPTPIPVPSKVSNNSIEALFNNEEENKA